MVCGPLEVPELSHEKVYVGPAPVTGEPSGLPSSRNCTRFMATLSVALATRLIVPVTVAPFAGDVIETCGGVVSSAIVTEAWFDGALSLAAASTAVTL